MNSRSLKRIRSLVSDMVKNHHMTRDCIIKQINIMFCDEVIDMDAIDHIIDNGLDTKREKGTNVLGAGCVFEYVGHASSRCTNNYEMYNHINRALYHWSIVIKHLRHHKLCL